MAQSVAERSSRTVFVGNIYFQSTPEQLNDVLSLVGPVISFKLMTNSETGKTKGYGFCEYPDRGTARSAIRNLNEFVFMGRALHVSTSGKKNEEIKNDTSLIKEVSNIKDESDNKEITISQKSNNCKSDLNEAPNAISPAVVKEISRNGSKGELVDKENENENENAVHKYASNYPSKSSMMGDNGSREKIHDFKDTRNFTKVDKIVHSSDRPPNRHKEVSYGNSMRNISPREHKKMYQERQSRDHSDLNSYSSGNFFDSRFRKKQSWNGDMQNRQRNQRRGNERKRY